MNDYNYPRMQKKRGNEDGNNASINGKFIYRKSPRLARDFFYNGKKLLVNVLWLQTCPGYNDSCNYAASCRR
jgi:hypothetical protein